MAATCALLVGGIDGAHAQKAKTVKVGVNKVISDVVFYVAQERGFFAEQKLTVEFIPFDSEPRMIAPLAAGWGRGRLQGGSA